MKTEVKKLDKFKHIIKVEIGEETLKQDKSYIYRQLSTNLKIPGFRPGTAPLELIEKHHGSYVKKQFLKEMLPKYCSQALKDNNLNAADSPRIYDVDFGQERLTFYAEFEVIPSLEIKDSLYKGLRIKHKKVKVEEIEVEKAITKLKEEMKKITHKDYDDLSLAKCSGYPTVDELKEAIRCELQRDKLSQRRQEIETNILEELLKRIKVDIPSTLIKRQTEYLLRQKIYNLQLKGVEEKDIERYKEDIRGQLYPLAERQLKLYHILSTIAKQGNLEVNQDNLLENVIGYILIFAEFKE